MADPTQRDRYPAPLVFPKSFNPIAVDQWFEACQDLPADPDAAWKRAVVHYTYLCQQSGIAPFTETVTPNFAIKSYLTKKRRKFILFLNATKLMDKLPVIRLIKRQAYLEPYGFSLVIDAQVRIEDPTWYRQLTRFRLPYQFSLMRDKGRFVLKLDPGLTVYVYNPVGFSKNTWHIGYEVKCPVHPDYEGLDADRQTFILNHLWMPLSTTFRPTKGDRIRYL